MHHQCHVVANAAGVPQDAGVLRIILSASLALLLAGCAVTGGLEHQAAPGALGPYSGAVLTEDLIFISGKIGERGGEFDREVETAIDAVEQELTAAGATLADVVSVTVFFTSLDDYARFNEIYARRFAAPYPSRGVAAVASLPGGARVEIQAIAARP